MTQTASALMVGMGLLYAEVRTMDRLGMSNEQLGAQVELESILATLMNSPLVVDRLAGKMDDQTQIECIKTGANVFCAQTGMWAYGDLFRTGSSLFLRAVRYEHQNSFSVRHCVFLDYRNFAVQPYLLVTQPGAWSDFDYRGAPC